MTSATTNIQRHKCPKPPRLSSWSSNKVSGTFRKRLAGKKYRTPDQEVGRAKARRKGATCREKGGRPFETNTCRRSLPSVTPPGPRCPNQHGATVSPTATQVEFFLTNPKLVIDWNRRRQRIGLEPFCTGNASGTSTSIELRRTAAVFDRAPARTPQHGYRGQLISAIRAIISATRGTAMPVPKHPGKRSRRCRCRAGIACRRVDANGHLHLAGACFFLRR